MASHAVNFLTLSNVYGKEKETRNRKGHPEPRIKAFNLL
jgi:hypothetical protein